MKNYEEEKSIFKPTTPEKVKLLRRLVNQIKDDKTSYDVEYGNDVGPDDDYFVEFFKVGPFQLDSGYRIDDLETIARLFGAFMNIREDIVTALELFYADK